MAEILNTLLVDKAMLTIKESKKFNIDGITIEGLTDKVDTKLLHGANLIH